MSPSVTVLLLIADLAIAGAGVAAAAGPGSASPAPAIAREVERIAGTQSLWPGFTPLAIPLAIWDGEATWLFRHPSPPAGFSAVGADGAGLWMDGRHPAVASNSSADIGGVTTATLLADGRRGTHPPALLAAVALHEAFHVFQRTRHPSWIGDEAALLADPIEGDVALAARRLESTALGRALAAPGDAEAACWARQALAQRAVRFAARPPELVAYERATELNEGLASYIELRAAGERTVVVPAADFPPAEVRQRSYAIGPALAFLLDRLAPGWPARLEADDTLTLDGLLAAAVAPASPGDATTGDPTRAEPTCAFTATDREIAAVRAAADLAAVGAEERALRRAFDATPETRGGWHLVVEADTEHGGEPLWPQGFDPLNVCRIDGGLLHRRFLQLGNRGGRIELLAGDDAPIEALTEAAGAHPLFAGVWRVTIALPTRPRVEHTPGGRVSIAAPGLTAELAGTLIERSERTLLVQIATAPGPATAAPEPAPPDATPPQP